MLRTEFSCFFVLLWWPVELEAGQTLARDSPSRSVTRGNRADVDHAYTAFLLATVLGMFSGWSSLKSNGGQFCKKTKQNTP